MRRTPFLLVAAVLAVLPARAEPAPPVATIVTPNFTFLPGGGGYPIPLRIAEGGTVAHLNVDPAAIIASSWGIHGIRSNATDDAGAPIFRSDQVGFGGVAVVEGVEELEPGLYPFHCSAHGDLMFGTLEVVPG